MALVRVLMIPTPTPYGDGGACGLLELEYQLEQPLPQMRDEDSCGKKAPRIQNEQMALHVLIHDVLTCDASHEERVSALLSGGDDGIFRSNASFLLNSIHLYSSILHRIFLESFRKSPQILLLNQNDYGDVFCDEIF